MQTNRASTGSGFNRNSSGTGARPSRSAGFRSRSSGGRVSTTREFRAGATSTHGHSSTMGRSHARPHVASTSTTTHHSRPHTSTATSHTSHIRPHSVPTSTHARPHSTSSYAGSRPSHGPSRFSSSRPGARSGGYKGGSSSRGRGGFGGGSRNRKSGRGEKIDFSRFINKSVETLTVEKFVPEHKFVDFLVEQKVKDSITTKGYVTPTPIQDKTIPHILKGADVVGIANTGTGKTGAFLIPLINKIVLNPKEQVLIVVPTRELAIQIEDELRGFTKGMNIHSVVCVGGMSIGKQISQLHRFHHFIIGTPGRLKDLINRRKINLSNFKNVVLDEADRMLDMGFIDDMRYVMSLMSKERQTLFFSATMSSEIQKLIGEFLKNPISISVKTGDTSKNVDQDVVRFSSKEDKMDMLHSLLIQPDFEKVIIFGRTKRGVENLSRDLIKRGFRAESIHGDKNHSKRQRALQSFKEHRSKILVATDVAARGLDIPNVSHVINFDVPETYDDYVHRIGRTGRGDKKGKALTFVNR